MFIVCLLLLTILKEVIALKEEGFTLKYSADISYKGQDSCSQVHFDGR